MRKKQLAFVIAPAMAVAMMIGGAAQRDFISRVSGGLDGGGALPTGGTVVFANSVNTLGFLVNGNGAQWGDGCTLAGTDRMVTCIILPIHSLAGGSATCDVTVRFYEGGDSPAAKPPGAMLWQSETFTRFAISPGLNQYLFEVPDIVVPDSMTWTLETSFCDTEEQIGSRFISPPTTGTSQSYLWNRQHNWEAVTFDIGGPNSDLGAIITAVPAPVGVPGDANCDGKIDAFDIDAFLKALFMPEEWHEQYPGCDILVLDFNGDGTVDADDIEGFLNVLFQ